MNEFFIQVISGTIAAVLGAFLQPRSLFEQISPRAKDGSGSDHSAHASNISGHAKVTQTVTDNRTINNIHVQGADSSAGSDISPAAYVVIAIIATIAAVALFVLGSPLIGPIIIGGSAGILLQVARTAVQHNHQRLRLDRRAWTSLGASSVGAVTACVAWILVETTERDGISVARVLQKIPPATPAQRQGGISGEIDRLVRNVAPAITTPPQTLNFLSLLLLATLASLALLMVCLLQVEQCRAWGLHQVCPQERTRTRAERFATTSTFGTVAPVLLLGVVAILFASGTGYDLFVTAIQVS